MIGFDWYDQGDLLDIYLDFSKGSDKVPHKFWTQINVKDADMLEGVQRRAIKIIQSLIKLSHEERLKRLGMFSLRHRRFKDVISEMFKMIHGTGKLNLGKLFCIDKDGRTSKHNLFKN